MKRFLSTLFGGLKLSYYHTVPYLPIAYEAVKLAREIAPNKTTDEIIRLSNQLGVPEMWGDRSPEEVIRNMVANAIRLKYPDIPDSLLNRSIEIAYGALKHELSE